jgi:general secretion pathway protein A
MSEQHRAAYAHLTYALNKSNGFTVITGEAGTGKTTLIQMMLAGSTATRARRTCSTPSSPPRTS